jgi:TRAP-type C4-dicarboxylate transport system permease small subunit
MFRELSPRPVQRVFEFLSYIIMTAFGLTMAFYGYKLTLFRWPNEIPLIHVTDGLRAIPIMISGVFIVLFSIGHLIHFFNGTDPEETL